MAKAVVSGGTGFVGRFIVEALLQDGYDVTVTGRAGLTDAFFSRAVSFIRHELDPSEDCECLFDETDLFVHAAFDHVPGRYRGGEGDDPEKFRRKNHLASTALFQAARKQGVKQAIFLSSRAVYGTRSMATVLEESMECHPDTLYGAVKLAVEQDIGRLVRPGFETASLRVTGVYGPAGAGRAHKWSGLIADYLAGRVIAPRVGTEVHGDDVGAAILTLLRQPAWQRSVFNVSDIVVDRRDVLEVVRREAGVDHPLPERADARRLGVMATEGLRGLGWHPGGKARLDEFVSREAGLIGARHP